MIIDKIGRYRQASGGEAKVTEIRNDEPRHYPVIGKNSSGRYATWTTKGTWCRGSSCGLDLIEFIGPLRQPGKEAE